RTAGARVLPAARRYVCPDPLFTGLLRRLPTCTLFPYTTLFRSRFHRCEAAKAVAPEPWRRRIGSTKLVAADHGSIHHFNAAVRTDRKSTRLNSSHGSSSYAVFCLKKKMQHGRFKRVASHLTPRD